MKAFSYFVKVTKNQNFQRGRVVAAKQRACWDLHDALDIFRFNELLLIKVFVPVIVKNENKRSGPEFRFTTGACGDGYGYIW